MLCRRMIAQALVSFLYLASVGSLQTPPTEDFYYAAVVEYHPVTGRNGTEILLQNAQQISNITEIASSYADIIVFPESCLLHGDVSVYVKIPFGGKIMAPADDDSAHPALQLLSKAARRNKVYLVVNIHEEFNSSNTTTVHYNTNVVFDRNGTVVARYRKYNLFSEVRFLNITETPEHMFFDSDFGVRFGTFTCFDILFREPALKLQEYNVTDYLFPTWWFSELPLLTAVQQQAAWAYATDSNLLAAGGNSVGVGSSGSGIYAGRKGALVYMQTNWDGTSLLSAKVFKKGKNGTSDAVVKAITQKEANNELFMKRDSSLEYYNTLHLTPDRNKVDESNQRFSNDTLYENIIVEEELCQTGFCCYFSINMSVIRDNATSFNISKMMNKSDQFNIYEYKLATFNGIRSFDGFATGGIQVCAIIPCLNRNLSSCGRTTNDILSNKINSSDTGTIYKHSTIFNNIIIKTATLDEEAFAEPNILESSDDPEMFGSLMDPSRFKFYKKGSTSELRLSSGRLVTAGIFARVFSRDGSKPGIYSSSTKPAFSTLFIFPVIVLVICWRLTIHECV